MPVLIPYLKLSYKVESYKVYKVKIKNKKNYFRNCLIKIGGFTLVELLITVSIIAILGVILVVNFSSAQKSGRDQRRVSDLKAVQSAAEQYYLLNNSRYPISTGVAWTGPGAQVIMDRFPTDPKNVAPYVYYFYSNSNISYCVCAKVENYKYGNHEGTGCTSFGEAAINNCKIAPNNCYFCVRNQQ